jgi:hypothetical protein
VCAALIYAMKYMFMVHSERMGAYRASLPPTGGNTCHTIWRKHMKALFSAVLALGIIAAPVAFAQDGGMDHGMKDHGHMHCKMVVTKTVHHGKTVITRTRKCM